MLLNFAGFIREQRILEYSFINPVDRVRSKYPCYIYTDYVVIGM